MRNSQHQPKDQTLIGALLLIRRLGSDDSRALVDEVLKKESTLEEVLNVLKQIKLSGGSFSREVASKTLLEYNSIIEAQRNKE